MDRLVVDTRPYNPGHLFDILGERYSIKTDVKLGILLGVGNPSICKIRRRIQPISGSLLIRIHEVTGLSIRELKDLMGDRRSKQRASKNKLIDARALRHQASPPPRISAVARE